MVLLLCKNLRKEGMIMTGRKPKLTAIKKHDAWQLKSRPIRSEAKDFILQL
jgi:hypothetical protein